MDAFSLLSKEMQRKIWEMGWNYFTPIQEQTIPKIIETNNHIIISSGTASGKTEAAFLPILSEIGDKAQDKLKVIYISPLKALINNQFTRIEELSEHIEIPIHRWHGDIDQSKKKKLTKSPSGILQITPESIESLFINRTEYLTKLFEHLEFIVIDEIHAFLDNERGVQLRSLLSRIDNYSNKTPRIIGLSATLNNFDFIKEWVDFQNPNDVEVIESKDSDKELLYSLMHFQKSKDGKIPIELYEDLRELTKESRSIVFCNSRGAVEETTVSLNHLSEKEGVKENYLAHHSSIDKKEREFVEKTLSDSDVAKSVVATSSLELGIDIGSIELVVQMDSTYSVSSLKQRLGRSGRGQDSQQLLQMYSTENDGLVQAIAVMELNLDKWVEPSMGYTKAYDVLFHQIISICQETNGIHLSELIEKLTANHAFYNFKQTDLLYLIRHMIKEENLEQIKGSNELIVGIEGERILRSKEFYAVFSSEEVFEVYEGTRKLGELDQQFKLDVGDHVILTGKLWRIIEMDINKNKIYVSKAVSAKKPKYFGGPVNLHPKIAEKMFEILTCEDNYPYINHEAENVLNEMRANYRMHNIQNNERVIWEERDEYLFEIFSGSKIVNTLVLMFRFLGVETKKPDGVGRLYMSNQFDVEDAIQQMTRIQWDEEDLLPCVLENEFLNTKFSPYIPRKMREKMHAHHRLDIQGTMEYLKKFNIKFVKNQ
jgi:ATP-dependent helicase Lhr and Lhr-like helicase